MPAALLQHADTAMYHAKHHGKGFAVTWTKELLTADQPA